MRVVSNTSPLSNLAIIGRLELVREQLGSIAVPPAVGAELSRMPHAKARGDIESAFAERWIQVVSLNGPVPDSLERALDIGEAEALTLAVQSKAPLILLDESAARLQASRLAIPFTGALGILRNARRTGRIMSLRTEMDRLRVEARFFIGAPLEEALLISVGEL